MIAARLALVLALLALPACVVGGANGISFGGGRTGASFGLLVPLTGPAASGPSSLGLRAQDGTECGAVDYAAGLVVTAAHCATADHYALSDGRTAYLLRRGNLVGLSSDVAITENDVALLLPSRSGPAVPLDRGSIAIGSVLLVVPPDGQPVACPLDERRGIALLMNCQVESGWSGSPVYVRAGGQLRLVGLLSGYEDDRRVSWALHISAIDAFIR